MRGREPFKTWFRQGIEIRAFNQILRQNTLQNKLFYFSEKKLLLGTL